MLTDLSEEGEESEKLDGTEEHAEDWEVVTESPTPCNTLSFLQGQIWKAVEEREHPWHALYAAQDHCPNPRG